MEAKSIENKKTFSKANILKVIVVIILSLMVLYFIFLYRASMECIIDKSFKKVDISPYDIEILMTSKQLQPYLSKVGIPHKPKQITMEVKEVVNSEGKSVSETDYRILFIKASKNTLSHNQSSVMESTSFHKDDKGNLKFETDYLKDGYYTIIIQNLSEQNLTFKDLKIKTK